MDPGHGSIGDIDARVPELQSALDNLPDHGEVEQAGRLVTALLDYGLLRPRPDVLGWSNRVTAADPHHLSPQASRLWGAAAYAAWMGGDPPPPRTPNTQPPEVADP